MSLRRRTRARPLITETCADDWTVEQLDELFEKGGSHSDEVAARVGATCPDCGEVDGFHSGVCSSLTGVHHVGWDLHAQRGTKPYADSDTTGGTW